MFAINERIKYIRKHTKKNQTDFGAMLGVSKSAVQKWESGENEPTDTAIALLVQKTGVSEKWLRTGVGEPFAPKAREQELNEFIKSLFYDRPESFRSRLLTTLLRFDPNGAEWEVLERIYDSVAAEIDTYRQEKEESDL